MSEAPATPVPTLSVVLPVYNEAKTIATVLDAVLNVQLDGVGLQLVIVESNSTDGTRDIVKQYEGRPGVRVVYEDKPSGKGHAVRTGDRLRGCDRREGAGQRGPPPLAPPGTRRIGGGLQRPSSASGAGA